MADKRLSHKLHSIARRRAHQWMKERYPGVPTRQNNLHDPELWAILYSRAVHDVKVEYGYVRPPKFTRKDYLGRFVSAASAANETGGVSEGVPQTGPGESSESLHFSPVRCGVY